MAMYASHHEVGHAHAAGGLVSLCAAVSTAHEQVKDGEVFHQLCQTAEQNVREQIGGGKVQPQPASV